MEGDTPVRENPGADRDLVTGRERKGGQPDRGIQAWLTQRNPWAIIVGMGGKHRRVVASGRQERRPGGRSIRDRAREGWEGTGAKRERSGADGYKMGCNIV